ncbi:MAG TPA: L-aspartate oxidase [Gemmatimonadaceae bacterium]|jgi:L-aspartate oxidase|nr:L-aspartate oxidase [Gemmatimonadaceae bacterium]
MNRTRYLVVGSGVAGLHTAWRAADRGEVVVLTKRSLFDSSTSYAQGGIAAAIGAGDSPELHWRDTLAAGAALCDADAVRVLVEEGPARVRELYRAGADFDVKADGKFKLGKEAAHSRRRIVHAHGDQTGAEVARTLAERVRENPRITVIEKARVLDLIVHDGVVYGVKASVAGRAVEIIADATVLATGGCGQVYRYTTNPEVATGDGYAIAHRAGARLADMEFVQFHPTALDTPENPLALISEAVRGDGAILVNADGKRFMTERHRLAELAPRDVVAREIFRERAATGAVLLDARKIGDFDTRFPGIFALCKARGIDPRTDLIPVTPAAHYMMGGVVVDLQGRSTLERLYACGEVSRTGVHGANRLASNSLLEGLVFAERVARDLAAVEPLPGTVPEIAPWTVAQLLDRGAAQVAAGRIRDIMWEDAGIARTAKGLRTAVAQLTEIGQRLPEGATEEANMVDTALLIAGAALLRKESRGGHYRADFPHAKDKWRKKHIEF